MLLDSAAVAKMLRMKHSSPPAEFRGTALRYWWKARGAIEKLFKNRPKGSLVAYDTLLGKLIRFLWGIPLWAYWAFPIFVLAVFLAAIHQ